MGSERTRGVLIGDGSWQPFRRSRRSPAARRPASERGQAAVPLTKHSAPRKHPAHKSSRLLELRERQGPATVEGREGHLRLRASDPQGRADSSVRMRINADPVAESPRPSSPRSTRPPPWVAPTRTTSAASSSWTTTTTTACWIGPPGSAGAPASRSGSRRARSRSTSPPRPSCG